MKSMRPELLPAAGLPATVLPAALLSTVLLSAVFLLLVHVSPVRAQTPESADLVAVRAALEESLPGTAFDVIRPSPVTGLYEVVTGTNLFYVNREARHLILGQIYDVQSHENLTEQRRTVLGLVEEPAASHNSHELDQTSLDSPVPWDQLPHEHAIVTNAGAPRTLAVFADVNCPYCRKLHETVRGMDDVAVHTFLIALWEYSEALTKTVLCAPDQEQALEQAYENRLPVHLPEDCDLSGFEAIRTFARHHGISSTPQIIGEKGRRVTGLRSQAFLKSWIHKDSITDPRASGGRP